MPLHQGTYNFKTPSSNAVTSCTQIENIQMKKHTEALLLLLHNTFLIIFVYEKHTQNSTKPQMLLNKTNQNVKEVSFCTFLEYYSIIIHSNFHSIIPKMAKQIVPKHDF